MIRQEYLILAMAVLWVVTSVLGAAFTIRHVYFHRKPRQRIEASSSGPFGIFEPAYAFFHTPALVLNKIAQAVIAAVLTIKTVTGVIKEIVSRHARHD